MNKFFRNVLEGVLFQKLFRNPFLIMDNFVCPFLRKYYMLSKKVDDKKVLFSTFTGAYTCNPKAIANEVIRRKLPWKLVWATCPRNSKNIPSCFKTVLQGSAEFYEEAATSKMWIANGIAMTFLGAKKKKNQVLVQTWHGAIGLKRFDTAKSKKWIKQIKADGEITDYCISNSKFEDDLYKSTFWKTSKILTFGHARNDILFNQDENIKLAIRKRYSIPFGAKVVMYGPTFRDDKGLDYYNIDYVKLRETLTRKFGGEWVILSRLHPRLKRKLAQFKLNIPDFVIDVTDYDDIQELMLIADVGITDYSSWICEYLYTGRPGFLFGLDLKSYYNERGFLFSLEEFPCPLAVDNVELCENIMNFDANVYAERIARFLEEKGSVDDGQAAKRIVDKLELIMK